MKWMMCGRCFRHFGQMPDGKQDIQTLPRSFEQIKRKADDLASLKDREIYYAGILTRFKQEKAKGNIMRQIEAELELIEREKELSDNGGGTGDGEDGRNAATTKVRSVVIMEMLRQMHCCKGNNDLTKICRLIAFLTGRNYDKIYNEAQKGISLGSYHAAQIKEANKILSDLNIAISIKKNNQY
ncbi:MAG: hypothetical protein IJM65_03950 [Bacteroidales bacterium]|nr:hypothetical protein [Bacteroidales bacterium]